MTSESAGGQRSNDSTGEPALSRDEPHAAQDSEALFDRWLEIAEGDSAANFDAFCAEHPPHADALRRLHAEWQEFEAFAGQIRERYAGHEDSSSRRGAEATTPSAEERLRTLRERGSRRASLEVRGEVGRGGMGIVERVYDPDLKREMARKVLRARDGKSSSAHSRLLARFLAEAQITGQLDHPGIVPVHELSLTENGDVCFTMALIKGRSLSEILRLVQWEREGWTRTRAVGVLLKICETLAYAHSKSVLHRDLKPSNVMVGRFGEVYVMDWGLAKTAEQEGWSGVSLDSQASGIVETLRKGEPGETPDWTLEGSVLGTPCYMAPEQAAGRLQEVGPRSDVYSLGAILYELCAGHPPYAGPDDDRNSAAILERLRRGPPPALHEQCDNVPPELQAICEKAMARHPDDRYASVQEMADDLRAYLEHRVVSAYETGTWAELRKWTRRNRMTATVIPMAIVVALASLGALVFQQMNAKEDAQIRASELDEAKQRAEDEAEALTTVVGWLQNIFELPLPERARGRVVTAKELVDRAGATLPAIEATPAVMGRLGACLGQLYLHLGLSQESLVALDRALGVCDEELGEEHPLTMHARSLRAQVLSEQGRFEESLEEFDRLATALRTTDVKLDLRLKILNDRAAMDLYRREDHAAEEQFRRALAIAEEAGENGVAEVQVLVMRNNLGVLLQRQQRLEEARAEFEEILRLREVRGEHRHPNTLTARMNLAVVIADAGQWDEGIAQMGEVIALREDVLGESHPETLRARLTRSSYLRRAQRAREAVADIERTRALADAALLPSDPVRLDAQRELGMLYASVGRADEGIPLLEGEVAARRARHGDSPMLRYSLRALARALEQVGRREQAIERLEECLRILRERGTEDRLSLIDALLALGRVHVHVEEFGKAELYLTEALNLYQRPPSPPAEWEVTLRRWRADAHYGQGNEGEAEDEYLTAIDLAREQLDPTNPNRRDLLRRYAEVLAGWDDYEGAVELMDEVLEGWADANSAGAQRDREQRDEWAGSGGN